METIAFQRGRTGSNRGNAYINAAALDGKDGQTSAIIRSWDCDHVGGEKPAGGLPAAPACLVQQPLLHRGLSEPFPHILADDYSKPRG